jgi:hypothetical protein
MLHAAAEARWPRRSAHSNNARPRRGIGGVRTNVPPRRGIDGVRTNAPPRRGIGGIRTNAPPRRGIGGVRTNVPPRRGIGGVRTNGRTRAAHGTGWDVRPGLPRFRTCSGEPGALAKASGASGQTAEAAEQPDGSGRIAEFIPMTGAFGRMAGFAAALGRCGRSWGCSPARCVRTKFQGSEGRRLAAAFSWPTRFRAILQTRLPSLGRNRAPVRRPPGTNRNDNIPKWRRPQQRSPAVAGGHWAGMVTTGEGEPWPLSARVCST